MYTHKYTPWNFTDVWLYHSIICVCVCTAHIQVYKKMRVTFHASRKFEDNSRVKLVRHEKYTAHK